jgi:methyl-accepting chemotaxis protein
VKLKLLIVILPIITIALISVSVINHNKAKSFLEENFEEKSLVQLELLQEKLVSKLETNIEILKNIASSSDVTGLKPDMQMAYLLKKLKQYEEFQMFFISDVDGNTRTTEGKTTNIDDRAYFKEVMSGKPFVISDPIISKTSDIDTVVFAVPIQLENDDIVGLIGTSFPSSNLHKIVEEVIIGESGYGYLTQADGLIISHPERSMVLSTNINELGIEELELSQEKALNGETGVTRYTFKDIEKYTFYTQIPQTNWLLYLTAPIDEASSQLNELAIISAVTALVVLIFTIVIVILFSSRLIRPLQKMSLITSQVADGDLTISIKHRSNDEIGRLGENFNAMVAKMQSLLNEIGYVSSKVSGSSNILVQTSEETKTASEQVAITISELATGTSDIASSVTNVSQKIQEMNATLNGITEFAKEVTEVSEESRQSANKGRIYVDESINQIRGVNESVRGTAEIIRRVDQHAFEIGEVISIITSIADQTNLLALNASIEAARAGEQGKGFAVVANEVRKLANETTVSAEKISSIIRETQHESHRAVGSIENGMIIVEEGMNAVIKAGESFIEISENVDMVSNKNENITRSIDNLEKISLDIRNDMESISAVTEQSSAGAEQVSAASEEQAASANQIATDARSLAELSHNLKELMSQFKLK